MRAVGAGPRSAARPSPAWRPCGRAGRQRGAAELVLAAARRQRRRGRRPTPVRERRERRERERRRARAERKDRPRYTASTEGRSRYGRLDLEISLFRNTLRGPWPMGRGRLRAAAGGGAIRSGPRVAPARPRRDLRRRPDQPGDLRVALRGPRLAAAVGASGHLRARHRLPRLRRRPRAQAHPAREPLRRRATSSMEADIVAQRRVWYWRTQVPPAVLARAHRRRLARPPLRPAAARRATSLDAHPADGDLLPQLRPAAAAVLLHEPPHPVRADALLRPAADEGLRAGRRRLGRQARGRPRAGRAEGRGDEGHRAVVGRARSSARRAASPSAACSSSAPRAPARRCSPRASRRRSTRRS